MSIAETFNAVSHLVDRHIDDGRGSKVAIECADERVTYAQLQERVNRVGNALKTVLKVRMEERVLLLLLDRPEIIYSFFCAMKIGAVPVPINTFWKPAEFEYALNDARARVLIIDATLLPTLRDIPRERLGFLEHVVVVGTRERDDDISFDSLTSGAGQNLLAAPTRKDDVAFWLYSSGSTGPEGLYPLA